MLVGVGVPAVLDEADAQRAPGGSDTRAKDSGGVPKAVISFGSSVTDRSLDAPCDQ